MAFLAFIIIGLLAGLLAHALMPGMKSLPDSWITTLLLGTVGSVVGGLIGSLFNREGRFLELHPAGLILSAVGAIIVLLVVGLTAQRRRRVTT